MATAALCRKYLLLRDASIYLTLAVGVFSKNSLYVCTCISEDIFLSRCLEEVCLDLAIFPASDPAKLREAKESTIKITSFFSSLTLRKAYGVDRQ